MVGVSALGRVLLEVLLMLFAKLFLDLVVIKKLASLRSSSKADEEALERDGASSEHDVGVEFGDRDPDIVHRHL